ncbi:PREDICTED: UPF0746 protein DDB_G0281095-like [Acropora digitifera]|uniref:UPF0746 protein DDB_G0281095-like n=1 Tax=Acropora digitifera TaxID=70779 RepID=UPI00077A6FDB|nr:PREDICTED: UPF0746 protein DDB_G0281095-like [Acropora digitifera]
MSKPAKEQNGDKPATKRVQFKGGKFEKSTVERLVTVKEVRFKADLDQRAVRDRYNLLANKLRRKLKEEEKASGIETDMTELEAALEDLIEREDQSDAQHKENQEENIKKKEDRDVAKDMRKKSLQRIGETQKRKRQHIQLNQVKYKRGSTIDAVAFLRERTEAMAAARKEEMTMQVQQQESSSKRHKKFLELMKQQQQQQHQQMHSMQAMLLQQQQQQSQLMMALLSKLQDK